MINILKAFMELPAKKKITVVTAGMLTIAMGVAVPVYAWFTNQRKAAEMFKVEYPNALYVNAAHREDRIFFNLDGINVNNYIYADDNSGEYLYKYYDANGNEITKEQYDPATCTKEAQKTTKYYYVFSVSGDNTTSFTLQMAHTNNNQFEYSIYEAAQYDYPKGTQPQVGNENNGNLTIASEQIVPNVADDRIIEWTQHANSHTENAIQVQYDQYINTDTSTKYYVRSENKIDGEYKNNQDNSFLAKNNDAYYTINYGSNTNVDANAIPSYWQAEISGLRIDNNKRFVKYFIVEVDCGKHQDGQEKKEVDLIYFSVERKS